MCSIRKLTLNTTDITYSVGGDLRLRNAYDIRYGIFNNSHTFCSRIPHSIFLNFMFKINDSKSISVQLYSKDTFSWQ
jgi:hypothetical protein